MPLLAWHYRNVKSSSLSCSCRIKQFCITLGARGTERTPEVSKPSIYTFIFRPKLETIINQLLLQPRELTQKVMCSRTHSAAVESMGFILVRKVPGGLGPVGYQIAAWQAVCVLAWLWPPVERGQGSWLADDAATPFSLLGGE